MGSFLTALTSIGSQVAEGKDEARQDKQARADKLRSLDLNDAYLQIAKQSEQRQDEAHEAAIARGDLMKVGNRLWSISKAKFVDSPQTPDPMQSLKTFVQTLPKEWQPGAQSRAQLAIEADPNDPKAAINAVLGYANSQQAETNRREDASKREQERREDSAKAEENRRQDKKDSRSDIETFEKSMVPFRLQQGQDAKSKELTPAATKIVETTMPTLQQADRLIADIDKLGLANNNQSGYLFPARLKYAAGMASPEGTLASDIAGLSLGSVVEAGSAMQGTSRSLVALKKALVHTPNPWKDSPMLMKRKLVEIKARLQDMIDDARKYGTKGPAVGGEGDVDIDSVLDKAFGPAK